MRNLSHVANGIEIANLVVGQHHRHEHGVVAQAGSKGVQIMSAPTVDVDAGHLEAMQGLQAVGGVEDCLVLDGAGYDVLSLVPKSEGDAEEGRVVGLGAPAREEQVPWFGIDQGTDCLAS